MVNPIDFDGKWVVLNSGCQHTSRQNQASEAACIFSRFLLGKHIRKYVSRKDGHDFRCSVKTRAVCRKRRCLDTGDGIAKQCSSIGDLEAEEAKEASEKK